MARRLDSLTISDVSALDAGVHSFEIDGPDGSVQGVDLYLSGTRRKARLMQWDLWPSDWEIGHTAPVVAFVNDSKEYWGGKKLPKGTIVSTPEAGGTALTLWAFSSDVSEWLLRAAKLLADQKNLAPLEVGRIYDRTEHAACS